MPDAENGAWKCSGCSKVLDCQRNCKSRVLHAYFDGQGAAFRWTVTQQAAAEIAKQESGGVMQHHRDDYGCADFVNMVRIQRNYNRDDQYDRNDGYQREYHPDRLQPDRLSNTFHHQPVSLL